MMWSYLKTRLADYKYLINLYWFSFWAYKSEMNNQSIANPSERDIDEAIKFALNNVGYIIGFLPNENPKFLDGKIILEVGPGQDFGVPLVLMGFGVKKAILIDKFFCKWEEDFHPKYYRQLLEKAEQKYHGIDFKDLRDVIKSNSHISERLELLKVGLENVDTIPNESVDITFSNACFEHLADSQAAVKELGRITKSGGLGFHQIDFRDHRNYDKPLEFLTMSDWVFRRALVLSKACHGNRLRSTEFAQFFRESGFEYKFLADLFSDDKYMKDVLTRINSKFMKMPQDSIRILSGRFFLKKKMNKFSNQEIQITILDRAFVFIKQRENNRYNAQNEFGLFKDKFQELLNIFEQNGKKREILILMYESDFSEMFLKFKKYSTEELSILSENHLSEWT